MALTTDLIENVMNANKSGNVDSDTAAHNFVQAIVDTIKLATIVAPATTGLSAPNGPVTGNTSTWTIE